MSNTRLLDDAAAGGGYWHGIPIEVDGRKAWLEARRQGIGASDVAAIVGLSPWRSAYSVWAEKVEGYEVEESAGMRIGSMLEDVVLQEFARSTGFGVGEKQRLVQHPLNEWALATLDGVVWEGHRGLEPAPFDTALGLVEAKTDHSYGVWDEIPTQYEIQVQWQLYVTGLQHAWIAVLHGQRDFATYELEADPVAQAALFKRVSEFYAKHIVGGEAPETDGSAATTRVLTDLWESQETEVDLDKRTAADIKQLVTIRERKADLEAEATRLENRIKAAMGDNEAGIVNGATWVTWKTSQRKGYMVEPGTTRRFLVKAKEVGL